MVFRTVSGLADTYYEGISTKWVRYFRLPASLLRTYLLR